ncbi:MAG: GNAT family N-acetyltransferase [Anaerolineae bacterium]
MKVEPLTPSHAAEAARLHLEGQPRTFLSDLGLGFLTVLYWEIARSPMGFGFVAQEEGKAVGVVAATESTSALFRHLLLRRPLGLAWAVGRRLVQKPGLALKTLQTLAYPSQEHHLPEAELLFIGVRTELQGQGLGGSLLEHLCLEARRRSLSALKVMVDAANEVAHSFYVKHGFHPKGDFTLYGRRMNWYELPLPLLHGDARDVGADPCKVARTGHVCPGEGA